MSWDDIAEALDAIRILCPSPRAISMETHDAAVKIARTHGFHMYNALVVASALAADCETLYTEDLQDGQVIEERLTIRNPFKTVEGSTGAIDAAGSIPVCGRRCNRRQVGEA